MTKVSAPNLKTFVELSHYRVTHKVVGEFYFKIAFSSTYCRLLGQITAAADIVFKRPIQIWPATVTLL